MIVSAILRSSAAWEDALATKSDLATFQQGMKSDMETFQHSSQSESATLRSESETFRSDFEALRSDVDALRTDVDALRADVNVLRKDVDAPRSDFGRLRIEIASDLAKFETKLTNQMFVRCGARCYAGGVAVSTTATC